MRLSYPGNKLVNDVADFIIQNEPHFLERAELFELIPDSKPSPELADGEDALIEIIIRYDALSEENRESIEQILAFANRGAFEIIMKLRIIEE
jgi:hypothetical protein